MQVPWTAATVRPQGGGGRHRVRDDGQLAQVHKIQLWQQMIHAIFVSGTLPFQKMTVSIWRAGETDLYDYLFNFEDNCIFRVDIT